MLGFQSLRRALRVEYAFHQDPGKMLFELTNITFDLLSDTARDVCTSVGSSSKKLGKPWEVIHSFVIYRNKSGGHFLRDIRRGGMLQRE